MAPPETIVTWADSVSSQWDYQTSVEEVMNGLHHLVASGIVLYLVRHLMHIDRSLRRRMR